MKLEKLLTTTEFVSRLGKSTDIEGSFNYTTAKRLRLVNRYADFISQPLKLGMFIPVGENNIILEPPIKSDYGLDSLEFNTYKYPQECYKSDLEAYQLAESKVLFKGWSKSVTGGFPNMIELSHAGNLYEMCYNPENLHLGYNMEILMLRFKFPLLLTEASLKQLKL